MLRNTARLFRFQNGGVNLQFVITAYDGKDMLEKRMEVRKTVTVEPMNVVILDGKRVGK